MKKKTIMLTSIITGLIILTIGITYAAYTYIKQGTSNSQLILGDIYMHYNETNALSIEEAIPRDTYDANNYFEFTIDGKNTYTQKDIYYEIVLTHGENHETRTIRIRDNLLKFRLVEVIDGTETELLNNESYEDLTSQKIWGETIPKNTTTEIQKTYRLYM